jgi:hypothetical protein
MRRTLRRDFGAGAFAASLVTMASLAVDASPLATDASPSDPVSPRISLLHRVLIYAKEGSSKLLDGRWPLGQSEAKLGIKLSTDETKQLMACTGKIVCDNAGGEVFASASSVLRPDLLVTAKHVFAKGRGGAVSVGRCSFRSFLHRNDAVPVVVEKDQRKGYFLNNEDFIVLRLKRALKGCNAFAMNVSDSSLPEGEQVFSVTGYQRHTLNKISSREPVLAKGQIKSVSTGVWGGPPFYYADIDLDEGGSGGAVFALKDGHPVSDDEGRLILRGILVAVGPRAKNGRPYSEDQNYTIIIGLQADFRDLVEGKAQKPTSVVPVPCPDGGAAKIAVIAGPVSSSRPETRAPLLQDACSGEGAPDRDTGKASASCRKLARELQDLAKGIETLAASDRGKGKHAYRLKNDTSCAICFTYNRCNDYGCWDEAVTASGKSMLFAGVSERAPVIKNPQFCSSGGALAGTRPPLPPKRPDAVFSAAKEKADRDGVWTLTAEDIRGLSLEQIKALRGY